MPFYSQHADKIWNRLYTVSIPDLLTQNPDYIKKIGYPSTGNKTIDEGLKNTMVTVMIPVIKIAEYYNDGIAVAMPSRKDMLEMYSSITSYLNEWLDYSKNSINSETDIVSNKSTINILEKLAKELHSRARDKELITTLFGDRKLGFGITTDYQRLTEEQRDNPRPDYEGISNLIKKKRNPNPGSRF